VADKAKRRILLRTISQQGMVQMSEQIAKQEPLALRVKDFCTRIGVSHSTFWKYQRAGKIRIIRMGRRVLVPASEALRIASEGLR
jgi:excisionase family DNA binding protein